MSNLHHHAELLLLLKIFFHHNNGNINKIIIIKLFRLNIILQLNKKHECLAQKNVKQQVKHGRHRNSQDNVNIRTSP